MMQAQVAGLVYDSNLATNTRITDAVNTSRLVRPMLTF
eukprot:SAG25_NODE_1195_length_3647_cov_3.030722_3_plen_38_part_00